MKLSIKSILIIICYCISGGISAQNINIYFPHFAGDEYIYALNRGVAKDTVQTGKIGADGRVTLSVPENLKGYTGMGLWSVVGKGEVDFIVDNEDFSITCEDSVPNGSNILYTGSRENTRRNQYDSELSLLFRKLNMLYQENNISPNNNPLPPAFLRGMSSLQEEYLIFHEKLAGDSSYAAFFIKTVNYMRGLGSRIYNPSEQKEFQNDLIRYIIDEIDITRLYSSGLWVFVVSSTFNAFEDESAWGEAMVKMLKRTKSQLVFEIFSRDLIMAAEQLGKEKAEQIIIKYLETSDRLSADPGGLVRRAIAQNKVKIGNKAPLINGEALADVLLIFYESGCDHCKNQLDEITRRYPEFVEKGIRVISISVDENKEVYEYYSKLYPWPDKLCDFKGLAGENFNNYGIVGTPTIYLIDKNGIIIDRQSRLHDIKELNIR
jgi:peroxiredoxin